MSTIVSLTRFTQFLTGIRCRFCHVCLLDKYSSALSVTFEGSPPTGKLSSAPFRGHEVYLPKTFEFLGEQFYCFTKEEEMQGLTQIIYGLLSPDPDARYHMFIGILQAKTNELLIIGKHLFVYTRAGFGFYPFCRNYAQVGKKP